MKTKLNLISFYDMIQFTSKQIASRCIQSLERKKEKKTNQ